MRIPYLLTRLLITLIINKIKVTVATHKLNRAFKIIIKGYPSGCLCFFFHTFTPTHIDRRSTFHSHPFTHPVGLSLLPLQAFYR